jgi:NAD(P)-dependent dehydrogenase (short-subunit alcohol dehydrogenase family)
MTRNELSAAYDLSGMIAFVTGGTGVLCSEIAVAMGGCGASVALLARDLAKAEPVAERVRKAGGKAMVVRGDVTDPAQVQKAVDEVLAAWGRIDALVNGAGGNNPKATTNPSQTFFDLVPEAIRGVFDLNIMGTIIPSQVVGKHMAARKQGIILNVSSMSAFSPLTRVMAYSAAKAGVNNFTEWLAVHMAQEYSPAIRVNAIAPGFFLTEQNRFLLTDKETGKLTERGQKILDHTPMKRFGQPADLLGASLWLLSPLSNFVTGVTLPVDGGFAAYSGV